MAKTERHIFPGNNTPEGFFSYYDYILGQREASRIYCIKGGPGVGKSTFMKKIAEEFLESGEDIDMMHCSSDPDSIDGIVLKKRKIAMIDGTSPHVVDPVNPGAVDCIINLGEFWNEDGLKRKRTEILSQNLKIKAWYGRAYRYLAAADMLYNNIKDIYEERVLNAEIYKLAAKLIRTELSTKEICVSPGAVKKYFASAITPKGIVNHIDSLIAGCDRVYALKTPIGVGNEKLLKIISEGAVYRGIDVEEYYCSMRPREKLEHLILPEYGIAFFSLNEFHEPDWARGRKNGVKTACAAGFEGELVAIDMNEMIVRGRNETEKSFLENSLKQMREMIKNAVLCLNTAKKEHDVLERYYIPNMDFKKTDEYRNEIVAKIRIEHHNA